MATAQATLTQNGMLPVSVHCPEAISARVITPIVFCASLVPWASETSEAEPIWPQRKPRRVASATPVVMPVHQPGAGGGDGDGDDRRDQRRQQHLAHDPVELGAVAVPVDPGPAEAGDGGADQAAEQGVRGARRQAQQPGQAGSTRCRRRGRPARSSATPRRHPPVSSGCGAPSESWILTTALVTVRATSTERKAPTRLRAAGQGHRHLGLQGAGRDRGGHRVAGVVEPVGEVEGQGGHDHQSENDELWCHASTLRRTSRSWRGSRGVVRPLFT